MWCFLSSRTRHTKYWRYWSSDVCSSDLLALHFEVHGAIGDPVLAQTARLSGLDTKPDHEACPALPWPEQIGRASCRERVKITGVALSLIRTVASIRYYNSKHATTCVAHP